MKTTYKKLKLKIISCCNYKSFSNDSFTEMSNEENCHSNLPFATSMCNIILYQHAPKKKIYKGWSNAFSEEGLVKGNLGSKLWKNNWQNWEKRNNYSKQRNLCVTLLQKSKRECFVNLDEKSICNNRKLWSGVK